MSRCAPLILLLAAAPAGAQSRTVADAVELQAQGIAPGATRVGDVFQGQGGRNDDADWNVALQPGCYVLSAAGGPGVERLYLSFFEGKERLAKVSSKTPLAALVQCVKSAGTFRLRATLDEGKGAFAMAVYAQPASPTAPDLDRLAEAYAAAQLPTLQRSPERLAFAPGAREQEWLAPVREGVCTTFVGVAEAAAKELSLTLLHPNGKEQAKTRDAGQVVALEHCAKQSGTFVLRAKLGSTGAGAVARFEAQPASGRQGLELAADRLGKAFGATSDAVQVLVAQAKDGEDCDWKVPLDAGCFLVSTLRGSGVEKVELSLSNPSGQKTKATDARPAVLCATAPGLARVRATIDGGKGPFAVALHRVESAAVQAAPKLDLLCDAHAAALVPAGARVDAWDVPPGKRPEWVVPLQAGSCYSFVGVGQEVKELKLTLRSATNKEQAKSREDRARAALDFCPKDPGSYKLVAEIDGKGTATVVRYERAAPAPAPVAAAPAEPSRPAIPGFSMPNVNVTVNGATVVGSTLPGVAPAPGFPQHHVSRHGVGQVGGGSPSSGGGTCCVNGRFYACSSAGMTSCSEVMSCMSGVARDAMNSSGSMEGFASRADGCARKLDTFACTADSSRNGECKR